MKLRLLDVTSDDLPLIGQWLQADQVRQYWGDPGENMRQELDVAGLTDIPESVIDIDIMIGEQESAGRGIGSATLRLVAENALADPAVPFVIGCARSDNLASLRAFARAGFREDREFDDVPYGRHVLMVRRRGEPRRGG